VHPDRYVIIWRDSVDAPAWSTFTNPDGKARTFTMDDPEMTDVKFGAMVMNTAQTKLLLPANAEELGEGHVAVLDRVAVEWLGWPVT
jgi:hypothetical protein